MESCYQELLQHTIILSNDFPEPEVRKIMQSEKESAYRFSYLNIIVILILLIFISLQSAGASETKGSKLQEAPPFQLSTSDGQQFSIPDSRGDGATILVFWAFWCDTWKTVVEGYNQLSQDMKSVPFKYYVIAIDPAMPEVVHMEKKDGNLPFPVLVDKDGTVSKLYKIKAVPTFFVLDKKGRIILRHEGYPGNAILKKLIWESGTQ